MDDNTLNQKIDDIKTELKKKDSLKRTAIILLLGALLGLPSILINNYLEYKKEFLRNGLEFKNEHYNKVSELFSSLSYNFSLQKSYFYNYYLCEIKYLTFVDKTSDDEATKLFMDDNFKKNANSIEEYLQKIHDIKAKTDQNIAVLSLYLDFKIDDEDYLNILNYRFTPLDTLMSSPLKHSLSMNEGSLMNHALNEDLYRLAHSQHIVLHGLRNAIFTAYLKEEE